MRKFIIFVFLFFSFFFINAQEAISFQQIDSITETYYLQGKWNELILKGNEAINQQIDYKKLRQRMGYAYFAKSDFHSAQHQYEKALTYDESDSETQTYLYYTALNIGENGNIQYRASKLDKNIQKSFGLKSFKILNSADAEYNYKINDESQGIRSNPSYYRLGVSSQLGYRLYLYQAISQYTQTVNKTTQTVQNEYYGLLSWIVSSHSTLNVGYHYVNTIDQTNSFKGNMFFGKFTSNVNRFNYGANTSILSNLTNKYYQVGIFGGVNLPGTKHVYLKSSLNCLVDSISSHFIFSQSVGMQLFQPLWIEGSVTLGNLKNYNDNDGLYLYNSLDATTFRTGLSLFYLIGKNITLVGNYTYDIKEIASSISNTNTNYNQHSLSGGIIWKI